MRTLTLAQLIEHKACENEVNLFKEHFGKSVIVTEELAVSLADVFDFSWAGRRLLSKAAQIEFERARVLASTVCAEAHGPAQAEYSKVTRPAQAERDRECTSAWVEYRRVCGLCWVKYSEVCDAAKREYTSARESAWVKYERAVKPAVAEYDKVCLPARAEHDKVCAVTFAKLYNADQT